MTHVSLAQRPGTIYTVTCEGHATGSLEMCAAISCLTGSLEGWVENSPHAVGKVLEIRPGFAQITFVPAEGADGAAAACQGAFDLLQAGFLRLEATGSEYLSVEREEI